MELGIIESLASLGIGAIFGIVVFFIYRQDKKSSEKRLREDRKFMEDRLTNILEKDQKTREDNTKAISELTILLIRLNGRLK